MTYKIIRKSKRKENKKYIYGEFKDKTQFYADDSGRVFSERKITSKEARKITKELSK